MIDDIRQFFANGPKRRQDMEALIGTALHKYLGPTGLPARLDAIGEVLNPVVGMEQAGTASQTMMDPSRSLWDRVGAGGRMATEIAGVAAPMGAARVAGIGGDDAARAIEEALLGFSATPTAVAGKDFAMDEAGAINLDSIRSKFPGVKIDISGNPQRGYVLNKIVVPEGAREKGLGSAVMQDILRQADESGATVSLSPSGDFGGTTSRLKDFYKRLGFVENKGKARDFGISEDMYRPAAPLDGLPR